MSTPNNLPHILLIGSTGRTGRLTLLEALQRTHTVTALARDPTSLTTLINDQIPTSQRSNLRTLRADPTSKTDMSAALTTTLTHASGKPIVIISTLGQTRKSGNPWATTTSPPMFMTRAAEAVVSAISSLTPDQKTQIEKLIVMSMFGVGASFENLHCMIKPVMNHSNMAQTVEDHNGVDGVIRGQKEVKWVMVRPSMLKEGGSVPIKVRGEEGVGEGWMPSGVTVGSVVEFMMGCVGSGEWDGRTPVVCN
ncbi:hypothetical protein PMZ80_004905 [Knufia obscura]|uniref:NAD(P)-binding domain-containing protein n=1 Tax=Knufia obscura TaxID=1635080 RepID=A0ABR0RP04_9EURO|nr:hypothetical protein PMZ80_004905 [Knufia obscura]